MCKLMRMAVGAYDDSCELLSPPWYGWSTKLNQGSVPVESESR